MAAYAAVVSLMNTMEQIMNHPRLSTSLDKHQIESLGEKVGFLLDFVESYHSQGGSRETEDLKSQIASAAYSAEDVIESHIADQIHAGSLKKSLTCLIELQKIILDMDSIKEKVMKVKEERGLKDQQLTYSMPAASSRTLTTEKTTMVGFDGYLTELLDGLTGQESNRQIISIVGMGGIGKTTLARNVYENSLLVQHFDVRIWVTISQDYNVKRILLEALSHIKETTCEVDTVDEFGEELHKNLSGRRYLIMLDDMWSIEVWDKVKFFFPDNGNRSRVVLTTRLSNVATYCSSSCFRMNFLDGDKSWSLFCEKVFGQEYCPPELEKIGKEISQLCKGLPLSIAVIGGLLRKSYRTIRYWENVAKNINSILNSEENEQCLDILSLSYSHLPAHLKPCFLYMGVFKEDCEIRVSQVIKLWVAEGFLKPNGAQILEEIAEGYLKDLIDRNLILLGKRRKNGKIRSCRIHDLLRDLCLRIAAKENFFSVARMLGTPQAIGKERRIVFHDFVSKHSNSQVFHALQSASHFRSLIFNSIEMPIKFRLLRVLNMVAAFSCHQEDILRNVNLRYLAYQSCCSAPVPAFYSSKSNYVHLLPCSISLIWNLQTLIITKPYEQVFATSEIWKMPQLRHIECNEIRFCVAPQDDSFILGNLQTLTKVVNFGIDVAHKKIPNIKKLHMLYHHFWETFDGPSYHHLSSLGRLYKLESLKMEFKDVRSNLDILLKENLTFPSSLKKLSLTGCRLHWEDLTMIGALPQLEVLKLEKNSVVGRQWSPVNGEFLRLKFLRIDGCDLRSWDADSSHFPVLEKLHLGELWSLDAIPPGIGEIPTLEVICLDRCGESAVISTMKIKEERESLGYDGLQIHVKMYGRPSERFRERVEKEGLTFNNIQIENH